jgi:beta-lactamase class A
MSIDRRTFALSAASLALATPSFAAANPLADLEAKAGGRLGVAALNAATGARFGWRENERFAMCSTFKLLAVSAILHNVDAGNERLDRWVQYGQKDLLDYAPVTRANVGKGGLTLGILCAAAIEYSDNTAANLLLAALGGPSGVTAYARSIGDTVTRLDRTEPTLNTAIPGDPRDTTSPAAMLADLNTLTQGATLSESSRTLLNGWLDNCQTAAARIPAGLPANWTSGNKTGSGDHGTANDVAVINPPAYAPMFIAAYYTGSTGTDDARDAVLAAVGQIVVAQFRGA